MAKGNFIGKDGLSKNRLFPERRALWARYSNERSRRFNPCKYCGGVPAKTRHGISTVPQRCFGFPRRAGNSRCSCRRAELFISGEQRGPLGGTGPSGKNDDQLMQQGSTLTVAPVLPTGRRCALRYRLDILSSRSCPHAASTSRPAVLRNIERTPDISSV